MKGQFGPLGQLPFSHSRQWGLDRGSSWGRGLGSCSCIEERDAANLCWGFEATVGGVTPVGRVTWSWGQGTVVNAWLEDPSDSEDSLAEVECNHSHKGCRCDNLLVDTLYRAALCDGIVGVALELRMGRFDDSWLLSPQASQKVEPLSQLKSMTPTTSAGSFC